MYGHLRGIACSILLVMLSARSSTLAVTIDIDTIVDADNSLRDVVVIDGASPPTRLTVVDGGTIGSTTLAVDAYDSTIVDIRGGRIGSGDIGIRLNDESHLIVTEGIFDTFNVAVEAYDRSHVQVYDATIFEGINLFDDSRLLYANRNSTQPRQPGSIRAAGRSVARIIEGNSSGSFIAEENGRIILDGSDVEGLLASGNGRIDFLSGAIISSAGAIDNGVIHWRGGILNQDEILNVSDNAIVHFYGTSLRFETHPEFGDRVSGKFVNELSFATRYHLEDQGQIILHEVPEPGAWALLAIAAASFWVMRRAHLLSPRR